MTVVSLRVRQSASPRVAGLVRHGNGDRPADRIAGCIECSARGHLDTLGVCCTTGPYPRLCWDRCGEDEPAAANRVRDW